ncbi:MAG: hypothetical protein PHQ33_01200 [Bacteroidales bacterium]|jgi:hypothetical protein|nr:hypothetical protein [Bacteroidales bacterium]MDD4394489.1 hypothetical protein [Bacteroidales bacterium]
MKKLAFLNILLLLIVCNSCEWQEAEERGNLTQRGKQIYDIWDYSSQSILNDFVDKAFIFNAWYTANDSVKRIIEDQWFPYYKIRNDGNGKYGLYSGTTLDFSFETNLQSLTDSSANWTITRHNSYLEMNTYYSCEPIINSVKINYTNNMEWDIRIDSNSNSNSSALWHLHISGNSVPESISLADYELSGHGVFAMQNYESIGGRYGNAPTFLEYEIAENFAHSPGANWERGSVDILLYNEKAESLEIKGTILNRKTLCIHYLGIIEYWEIGDFFRTSLF